MKISILLAYKFAGKIKPLVFFSRGTCPQSVLASYPLIVVKVHLM